MLAQNPHHRASLDSHKLGGDYTSGRYRDYRHNLERRNSHILRSVSREDDLEASDAIYVAYSIAISGTSVVVFYGT
jgi:hypothetical protein